MSTGPQVAINYDNIPPEMQARKQWVLWGVDADNPKAPCQIVNPARGAKANNPLTWGMFEAARCSVELLGEAQGIGYEITPADGLVAIDFDHCIDPDGQLMEPFATWKKSPSRILGIIAERPRPARFCTWHAARRVWQ